MLLFCIEYVYINYDQLARRWVIAFTTDREISKRAPLLCVAVSETDNALGKYHRYSFDFNQETDSFLRERKKREEKLLQENIQVYLSLFFFFFSILYLIVTFF